LPKHFQRGRHVVSFEDEMMLEVAKKRPRKILSRRPPVVTVMGHVDHGQKTSFCWTRFAPKTSPQAKQADHASTPAHTKIPVNERAVFSSIRQATKVHAACASAWRESYGHRCARCGRPTMASCRKRKRKAIDHARAANVHHVAINKVGTSLKRQPEACPSASSAMLGLMPAEWGGRQPSSSKSRPSRKKASTVCFEINLCLVCRFA